LPETGVDKFYERKEGVIGEYFSIDEIEQRILNADGASWAKRSITDEDVHYQLDTRHRNEAIRRNVKDPDKRKKLRELLYEKKIDELFSTIKGYINESANNEELKTEHENYKKLLNYYISNKDGLIPYKQRGLILPPPSGKSTGVTPSEDDIVYRNCGAMESNIFSLIGFRMKGRRMSWSIDGGNHLAKLLTRKVTGKLGEVLEDIAVSNKIPKKYVEETLDLPVDNPPISSAKMPERVGKGWNGFVKGTISSAMKWAKDLFKIKLFD